jgi:hypothetical protein
VLRLSALVLLAILGLTGCAAPAPDLSAPYITTSPYEAPDEVLLAVAPFRNETGTTSVDPMVVSDKVVAAAEEIRGVRCLPLNRTLETMRALKLQGISTPADLATLARALNVDGVLAGSVTAYDPYTPTIGVAMVLYARPGSALEGGELSKPLDAKALQGLVREQPGAQGRRTDGIVAAVSEHLDGKNHQVLMDVRSFAAGRSTQADALGWKRYTAAMPLYEEFAAHFAVSRLMQQEWIRLGREVVRAERRLASDGEQGGGANTGPRPEEP